MSETETPKPEDYTCEICGTQQPLDDPWRWCKVCGDILTDATMDPKKWDFATGLLQRQARQAVAAFIERVKQRASWDSGPSADCVCDAFMEEAERHAQPATTERP